MMKLTKYCLLPWTFMQVHAGGMMQCCAVAPDTDLGDFILDYCDKVDTDPDCDPFNSEGLQAVREGILTGNLRPMCRNCFYVPHELITTEELERRLKELLRSKNPDVDLENADLRKVHAYTWMAISFTNRCNLSCVYCVQSVHKDSNPYFKMEFPYEYAERTLDFFASQGLDRFSTCVEGEATLYRYWCELFTKFHQKYPHIKMRMTTNLSRKYTEEELELLANYYILDISIDTLDPELFSQLRRNGKVERVLENIDLIIKKSEELGIKGPFLMVHTVLSNLTWRSLEALADYAFERDMGIEIGNYEERANTVAYQQKMIVPLTRMPIEEQREASAAIQRVKEKGERLGRKVGIQGNLLGILEKTVNRNYNRFKPYNDNPVFQAFYEQNPNGREDQYLDIVYDVDNISHEGIAVTRGAELHLEGLKKTKSVTVREIHQYKRGKMSVRYDQTVMLRYRKKVQIVDESFNYSCVYPNEDVEKVLLEILEWE